MNKLFRYYVLIGFSALLCSSCSYIQFYQQQTQLSQIQTNIPLSKLDKVNEYSSQTPYHKTYEFEFNNTQSNAYALIFYLSESRFSKSIIKHRYAKELHRDAIRIDINRNLLSTLEKKLPKANSVHWQLVANHISENEARDSYYILQEFIRLKIRDL